jgi:hypothetical protein
MEDHMFEQFIKERQYLQNVSPRTIQWYQESFKWLDNPNPNKAELKQFVILMREKGLKVSSCNKSDTSRQRLTSARSNTKSYAI